MMCGHDGGLPLFIATLQAASQYPPFAQAVGLGLRDYGPLGLLIEAYARAF